MRRGADLIGRLPDELLQHVLSLLPSRDAVQSSLLSRRWRDLWKSAPAVRVTGKGNAFRLFVDKLLLHRNDAAQLRSFEIDHFDDAFFSDDDYEYYYDYEDGEEHDDDLLLPCKSKKIDPSVDRWIEHALSTCRATSLTARFDDEIGVPWRPQPPNAFASQYLTKMHLELVDLAGGLLDFSPCPALLSLALRGCRLNGDALLSPSLERLSIIHCDIPIGRYTDGGTKTIRISTPNLRHLNISDGYDGDQTAPSLDRMPWLTTASIHLTGATRMYPGNNRHGCSLLHGLSEATTLELIASTPDTMTSAPLPLQRQPPPTHRCRGDRTPLCLSGWDARATQLIGSPRQAHLASSWSLLLSPHSSGSASSIVLVLIEVRRLGVVHESGVLNGSSGSMLSLGYIRLGAAKHLPQPSVLEKLCAMGALVLASNDFLDSDHESR
uniref:Uncharacterized protein n=1 Tax=Avena sativa TaxID=4498 RepID=A0ACD5XZK9_AVESA